MPADNTTGDPTGLGVGVGDGTGDGETPTLGDGLGPGPGNAELPPEPPPHPATTAAPSATAAQAPMANCLLLMIAFDSFKSYLPKMYLRCIGRSNVHERAKSDE
jgi:hypothetical protein